MAITEDLGIFLADFGVSCTAGAVTALGILDMPSQVLANGMVLSTDYTLTAKIQHSNTTTSVDFADVTGGGFTAAAANTAFQEKIYLNSNDLRRYVRVLFTVTGGTGTGAVSVVALGSKKYS